MLQNSNGCRKIKRNLNKMKYCDQQRGKLTRIPQQSSSVKTVLTTPVLS